MDHKPEFRKSNRPGQDDIAEKDQDDVRSFSDPRSGARLDESNKDRDQHTADDAHANRRHRSLRQSTDDADEQVSRKLRQAQEQASEKQKDADESVTRRQRSSESESVRSVREEIRPASSSSGRTEPVTLRGGNTSETAQSGQPASDTRRTTRTTGSGTGQGLAPTRTGPGAKPVGCTPPTTAFIAMIGLLILKAIRR